MKDTPLFKIFFLKISHIGGWLPKPLIQAKPHYKIRFSLFNEKINLFKKIKLKKQKGKALKSKNEKRLNKNQSK